MTARLARTPITKRKDERMSEATEPDMLQRIRDASVYELSFAFCRYAGLHWLSWPLGRMPYNDAQQLRDVVETITRFPSKRTPADCYQELRRIDNRALHAVLDKMGVPS